MEQTVTISYKTRKNYCNCCNQKLEKPETSHTREFRFSKDNCLEWLGLENWKITAEYPEELHDIVQEYVHETISFFATSSDATILIEDKEMEKVKKFILEEVIA